MGSGQEQGRHSSGPLAGTRVIDLTSNIAAPFASAVLADLGADVVHVEPPSGDDARRMSPRVGTGSAYFHVVNRNKTGERRDLRTDEDLRYVKELIASADVFVTNLRPGKLERMGLDSPTLLAVHPRLIHASLSAYGAGGPERDRAGYDAVLQARTGIASVTGEPDGEPVRAGVSVLDVGAGTWLALGVLAALVRRDATGAGGTVTTSLFETGVHWVAYHVAAADLTGAASQRHGSGHPAFAPYGIFPTGSGEVCLGIGSDALFVRMCQALDCPQLAGDPRFATNDLRVTHRTALTDAVVDVLSRLTADEAVVRLAREDVPADVVKSPEDLVDDAQAKALGALHRLPLPGGTAIHVPGLPITLDGERPAIRTPGPE